MNGLAVVLLALDVGVAVDGGDAKKLAKPVAILAPAVKRGFAATKLLAVDEGPGFNEVVQHLKWHQQQEKAE